MGPLTGVFMPNLRCLTLRFQDIHPDIVIPLIVAPNLTMLGIYSVDGWSSDTYNIMKRHYKLHQLHKIELDSLGLPIHISSVLADAPMVSHLRVVGTPILDAEAQEGIATGWLGPCLISLYIEGRFSVDEGVEWFDMLESRQKNVKSMVAQASNWRQFVTGIRLVELGIVEVVETFSERVDTLEALGTTVTLMES
ncbi:hypothetical protein AX14_011873 [Amanita brunnescens Koide BX004]|jgi:hypothetical protein|nr:hypothetical protein AX14_011873 [Amanita brunnescens Koide BX004]